MSWIFNSYDGDKVVLPDTYDDRTSFSVAVWEKPSLGSIAPPPTLRED